MNRFVKASPGAPVSAHLWLLALAGVSCFLIPQGLAAEPVRFVDAEKVLGKYCYSCHGNDDDKREADLNLQFFQTEEVWMTAHDLLDNALFAIEEGDMPPKKAAQPTPAERELVVRWLKQSIRTVAEASKDDPGLVVAPRLNHIEYDLVIRDLTGQETITPGRYFPRDSGGGEGFTNVGADLTVEAGLLEKWLEAARHVLTYAYITPGAGLRWKSMPQPAASDEQAAYYAVRSAWQEWHERQSDRQGETHRKQFKRNVLPPDDGKVDSKGKKRTPPDHSWIAAYLEGAWVYEYRDQNGLKGASIDDVARAQQPALLPSVLERFHQMLKRDPASLEPQWRGHAELARLWQGLPPADGRNRATASAGCDDIARSLAAPANNSPLKGLARELGKSSTSGLGGKIWTAFSPYPGMEMDKLANLIEQEKSLEAEAKDLDTHPYYMLAPDLRRNASKEAIAELEQLVAETRRISKPDPKADRLLAEKTLLDFASRAWRIPLSQPDLNKLMGVYDAAYAEKPLLDRSLKQALAAVLVSPRFLYRFQESKGATEPRPLSPREVAVRLAFALWGTLPDKELYAAAESGALSRPEGLAEQVRRMVAAPAARILGQQFAGQWLHFADFTERAQPDPNRFKHFTPEHARDMEEQAVRFFVDLFKSNRPLTWLIEADTMEMSKRLAGYYGLADLSKSPALNGIQDAWEKYPLPETQRGLLGMGAVLIGKSQPLRTSPIKRGAWVINDLLGTPMPDSPPGVPQISDDEVNDAGATVAQQMQKHRADPTCSSCHDKLDPMGLALENFGPDGKWRERDTLGNALITSATAPDGTKIEGVKGLSAYLLREAQMDMIARQFSRKLLGYLLGRKVELGDRDLVDGMVAAMKNNQWQVMPALEKAVASRQFVTRRDEPAAAGGAKTAAADHR